AADAARDPGEDRGVGRAQQGSQATWVRVRRVYDRLRAHAGGRDGERPCRRMLSAEPGGEARKPQVNGSYAAIPCAIRSATAMIVSVGLYPDDVGNTLPSAA